MQNEKKDFTSEFQLQLKKLRPWSFLIVALFLLFLLATLIIFIFELEILYLQIISGIILTSFIPLLFLFVKYLRCPNCKKFMGRNVGNFCPLCGVKIRSTEK